MTSQRQNPPQSESYDCGPVCHTHRFQPPALFFLQRPKQAAKPPESHLEREGTELPSIGGHRNGGRGVGCSYQYRKVRMAMTRSTSAFRAWTPPASEILSIPISAGPATRYRWCPPPCHQTQPGSG